MKCRVNMNNALYDEHAERSIYLKGIDLLLVFGNGIEKIKATATPKECEFRCFGAHCVWAEFVNFNSTRLVYS